MQEGFKKMSSDSLSSISVYTNPEAFSYDNNLQYYFNYEPTFDYQNPKISIHKAPYFRIICQL